MNFKLGAAMVAITLSNPLTAKAPWSQDGYIRVNGLHLDFWRRQAFGVCIQVMRKRESDYHPECHAGYLVSDRRANPNLPGY